MMINGRQSRRPMVAGAALLAALGLALAGCAADDTTSAAATDSAMEALEVSDVWAKESSLELSAAFATIANAGEQDDTLVAVEVDGVPEVQLHEVVDGVMREVEGGFPVPAGGELVMEPGGNHIMLMGLTEKIPVGSTLTLDMQFASGAEMSVEAPVRAFSMAEDESFDHTHGGGMDDDHGSDG